LSVITNSARAGVGAAVNSNTAMHVSVISLSDLVIAALHVRIAFGQTLSWEKFAEGYMIVLTSPPPASPHIRASACDPRGARKASVHIHGVPTGAALASKNPDDDDAIGCHVIILSIPLARRSTC
jgi:hypothetical protein